MKRPTTKRQREKLYADRGLRNRTAEETAEYLAMIAAQGADIEARGKRIAAQFDQHRQMVADEKDPQVFDLRKHNIVPTMGLSPIPDGPLADQIAAMTKDFFDQHARKKPS